MTAEQRSRTRHRTRSAGELDTTRNARSVLERAEATVKAFEHAFVTVRKERGVTQSPPTDEEQDLLRAALLFAGAGLDSLLKQLVVHALPSLLHTNDDCRGEFEKFVQRQLRATDDDDGMRGAKLLARVLCDEMPRERLMTEYSQYLTGGSLQSLEELTEALKALGADSLTRAERDDLRRIFRARNEIAHEMDIDLQGKRRKRRRRTKQQMLKDAGTLLAIGRKAIEAVEERLRD